MNAYPAAARRRDAAFIDDMEAYLTETARPLHRDDVLLIVDVARRALGATSPEDGTQ